jgi:hypothetical protein
MGNRKENLKKFKAIQVEHSKNRASDRYNLDYDGKTRREMNRKILEQKDCILLERISRKRMIYAITYEGKVIPVVFDTKTRNIVTFLPTETLDKHGIEYDSH